ncbi:MAG: PspA/IM30 family protein [Rhizobiaceae bacterium]
MFKQIVTLVRGKTNDAAEAAMDNNALALLRQQVRDCAQALETARRSASLAIAQHDQEARGLKKLVEQIGRLEARAVDAIRENRVDLAQETATTIARLEQERDGTTLAQLEFSVEIDKLKANVRDGERRLRELERGQRLAATAQNTLRLRRTKPGLSLGALSDAEQTLARLRDRQTQEEVAETALAEMQIAWCPEGLEQRLIEAGCGPETVSRADQIMARLQITAQSTEDNSNA